MIQAKELMIGDWVQIPDCGYVKVDTIFPDYICAYCQCDTDVIEFDCCCGIPLTEDILKANGFNKNMELRINDNVSLEYNMSNNHLMIYSLICSKKEYYFNMCIMAVHELQRVLRCCGLNDLADNFKLE